MSVDYSRSTQTKYGEKHNSEAQEKIVVNGYSEQLRVDSIKCLHKSYIKTILIVLTLVVQFELLVFQLDVKQHFSMESKNKSLNGSTKMIYGKKPRIKNL